MTSTDDTDQGPAAADAFTERGEGRHRLFRDLWSNPCLLAFALVWLAASAYILFFADLSVLHHGNQEPAGYFAGEFATLLVVGVMLFLARGTRPVDHTSDLGIARPGLETLALVAYMLVMMGVGSILGVRTHIAFVALDEGTRSIWGQQTPGSVLLWVGYNFVAYAVLPFLVFSRLRGYSLASMLLRFPRPRVWVPFAVVVGLLGFLPVVSPDYWTTPISAHLLTLGLMTVGTIMPVMILTQSLIAPRLAIISRSWVTGAVLAGLVYALFNANEFFLQWGSASEIILSLAWVVQVAFWGVVKGLVTLCTGSAWLHIFVTHTIHLAEAPAVARVFGLR
jgi:hypothetical protein